MNLKRSVFTFLCSVFLITSMIVKTDSIYANDSMETEIKENIESIINWKKRQVGISEDKPLLASSFLNNAGDTTGDWYPFGIGRIGYPDDYDAYLAVLADQVSQRYQTKDKLSDSKATEWHRISLAILAMGGDPTKFGEDESGKPINLIADGTYNRGKTESLGLQGINGWIWGLIVLDSMDYEVPEDAHENRDDIILKIIENQLEDGGFTLNGESSDADITAMAIQALAPYYNSEQTYTYTQIDTEQEVIKSVRDVIDEALDLLSTIQHDDASFSSWKIKNTESISQVIVALTTLGIDPLTDKRFIKNDRTLLDALMQFKQADGGFIHSNKYDEENPTALPDKSNSMASEQALYAFVSLYRFYKGERSLYDFREEMNDKLKKKIKSIRKNIDELPKQVNEKHRNEVEVIFNRYKKIPVAERRYVFNYDKLASSLEELNIENDSEYISQFLGSNKNGEGTITAYFESGRKEELDEISSSDIEEIKALPKQLTTEHYVDVVRFLDKLENATNRDHYLDLIDELKNKKQEIEQINREIESLNQAIVEKLLPIDQLTTKDRSILNKIIKRYEQLSEYDRKKIVNYEDVEQAKAKINSSFRAKIISIVVAICLIIGIVTFILRRKAKRKKKLNEFNDIYH